MGSPNPWNAGEVPAGFFQGLYSTLGPQIGRQRALEDEVRAAQAKRITELMDVPGTTPEEIQDLQRQLRTLYPKSKRIDQMFGQAHDLANQIHGMLPPPPSQRAQAQSAQAQPTAPVPAPAPVESTPQPTTGFVMGSPVGHGQGTPATIGPLPPPMAAASPEPTPAPAAAPAATPALPPPPSAARPRTTSELIASAPGRMEAAKLRVVEATQSAETVRQVAQAEAQGASREEVARIQAEGRAKIAEMVHEAKLRQLGYKTDPNDPTQTVALTDAEKSGLQKSQEAKGFSVAELNQAKAKREHTQMDLDEARSDLANAQAEWNRSKVDPNSPMNQRLLFQIKLAEERLNLSKQNYYAMNYGTDLSGNPLPGVTLLPDGTAVGGRFQANVRPTTPTRQMAETVAMLAPEMEKLITKLDDPRFADKLGPIMGRWNEFKAGKLGVGDPDFIAIRNAVDLMQTAEMRAHMGSRGGIKLLDKFEELNNADKMDAPTLKASLVAVNDFLSKYRDYVYGPTGPLRGAAQGGAHRPTPPPPANVQQGPPPPGGRTAADLLNKHGIR